MRQSYRNFIAALKDKWSGKNVAYDNAVYKVIDVDYNGFLLINKKAEFTDTTAAIDALTACAAK